MAVERVTPVATSTLIAHVGTGATVRMGVKIATPHDGIRAPAIIALAPDDGHLYGIVVGIGGRDDVKAAVTTIDASVV